MKTIFNILARIAACLLLSAVCVLALMCTVILAEQGSAWYLLTAAVTLAAFFGAIRCTIVERDDDRRDFDPKHEDPRAASCRDAI